MAQATYKKQIKGEQEVLDYLKKNPNANVKILGGGRKIAELLPQELGKVKEPQRGFVGNLVKSLTDPFVNLGQGALEAGNYGLSALTGSKYKRKFLSEEEAKNPLKFLLKNAAGAASFFVPAGAGLKTAVALGGLSGALSGYGSSDDKNTSKDILTGALLGGATGGILNKILGKGGKAAKEAISGGDDVAKTAVSTGAYQADDLIKNRIDDIARGGTKASRKTMTMADDVFNTRMADLNKIKDPVMKKAGYNQLLRDAFSDTPTRTIASQADAVIAPTTTARGFLGKPLEAVDNVTDDIGMRFKSISSIDDAIKGKAYRLKKAGESASDIVKDLGTGSQTNARMNFITQNFKGEEQAKALAALLDETSVDDPLRGTIQRLGESKVDEFADEIASSRAAREAFEAGDDKLRLGQPRELNKLQDFGRTKQYQELGLRADPTRTNFIDDLNHKMDLFDDALDRYNLPRTQKGISQLSELVGNERAALVANTPITSTYDDIVDDVSKTLQRRTGLPLSDAQDLIKDQMDQFIDLNKTGLTPDDIIQRRIPVDQFDLFALSTDDSLQGASGKLFKKPELISNREIAAKATLHDYANNFLKDEVAGYRDANDLFYAIKSTVKGRAQAFNTGAKGYQITPKSIVDTIGRKAQNQVARVAEKVGDVAAGQTVNIPGRGILSTIIKPVKIAGQKPTITRTALANTFNKMANPDEFEQTAIQRELMPYYDELTGGMDQSESFEIPDYTRQAQEQKSALINQLISQGWKTNEAIQYANAVVPEPQKVDKKTQSNIRSGLRSLDVIDQIISENPNVTKSSLLPSILRSSDARQYRAAIDDVVDAFGRLRSGGAVNAEEEERFRRLLPDWADDPATKAYKIDAMRQAFADVLEV